MATQPVQPTPVPATRPAPTPLLSRPEFVVAAFNWTADQEPFRQAMNVLANLTYTNALASYQSGNEAVSSAVNAALSAGTAVAARDQAQQMLASMQAIKEAVDAGGVYQVNGKQGIITLRDIDMWVKEHSSAGNNGQVLVANTSYSLYTPSAYSRPLPDRPPIGTRIRLHNLHGTWAYAAFTLTRPRASVTVNNVAENVVFDNGRIPFVTLEYIWEDAWTLG